ncbi:MAG: hypothetical protein GX934_13410 [Burkholderiales bacterium]|nr:hypothetical protein [Burkholderiales bacterium]
MASCPHCGGMAVVEEYIRTNEQGTSRVRIRRCVSLSRDRSWNRRRKDPQLRSTRDCGEVEILDEVQIKRTA